MLVLIVRVDGIHEVVQLTTAFITHAALEDDGRFEVIHRRHPAGCGAGYHTLEVVSDRPSRCSGSWIRLWVEVSCSGFIDSQFSVSSKRVKVSVIVNNPHVRAYSGSGDEAIYQLPNGLSLSAAAAV